MSGAASLAAAKRRRSKVDASRSTTSNTSTSNNVRSNTNNSNGNMPPRLNTQQSFQYIWQKVLQVESMVQNNSVLIKSSSSTSNNSNSSEINELRHKISLLEGSVGNLSNINNTVEIDGSKYVSIDQFNDVMNKVALDMQNVSEKVSQLSEFVSNVQNNNVILRNMLDSIQSNTFGFNENGSVGLSVTSSVNEEVSEGVEEDVEDVEEDVEVDVEEDVESDNNNISATPDVNNVLEKLKTLNSEDIKQEVTAELNNNITLVVEETNNDSPSESTN